MTGVCYRTGLYAAGVWTQGFLHGRQALDHVSLTPAPSTTFRLENFCVGKYHYKLFPSGISNRSRARKAGLDLSLFLSSSKSKGKSCDF